MQNLQLIIPGFDGPNGLSLSFGGSNEVDNDGVERRLVVDDDAKLLGIQACL